MKRPVTERKSKNTQRTNIPTVLTSFVGRKREIAEILQLLASTHLISLVGAGGCGKTRIALRVTAELTDQYIDGVYWVELARLADSTLVPQAVAKVLNVVEQSGTPLMDTLLDAAVVMHVRDGKISEIWLNIDDPYAVDALLA